MSKGRAGAVALGAGVTAAFGGIAVQGQDPRLSAALFAISWILTGVWLCLMILDSRD